MRGGRLWASRPIPIPPGVGARVARQRCPILRSGPGCCSRLPLLPPLLLELPRREVAQRRVNALDVVNVVEEAGDLPEGVGEVLVVGEVHLLFFDGPDQA